MYDVCDLRDDVRRTFVHRTSYETYDVRTDDVRCRQMPPDLSLGGLPHALAMLPQAAMVSQAALRPQAPTMLPQAAVARARDGGKQSRPLGDQKKIWKEG